MSIRQEIHVYHGSYTEVVSPELTLCRKGKDFGRGFYVTTDRKQAVRFTKTAIRKAITDGRIPADTRDGVLNEYLMNLSETDLSIYEFSDTGPEWLHCVVAHRRENTSREEISVWKQYDIIAGKIANDNTNLVIIAYMDGIYGEVGSARADQIAIGFLEPNNLKDQICFRSQRSLEALTFLKSESVSV